MGSDLLFLKLFFFKAALLKLKYKSDCAYSDFLDD